MQENFMAKIGAKIKGFQRKMKEVDNSVKETAMGTDKPIGADIDKFKNKMSEVEAVTKKRTTEATKPFDADIHSFNNKLSQLARETSEKTKKATKEFDADISEFRGKMNIVNVMSDKAVQKAVKPMDADITSYQIKLKQMEAVTARVMKRDDKTIGADISNFLRKAAMVAKVSRDLARDDIKLTVKANTRNFLNSFTSIQNTINKVQNRMDNLASTIRTFGVVAGNAFKGVGISVSSAVVPIIASLVPAIMAVGNAVGVLAGGTMGLTSAFVGAGVGLAGFIAVAAPAIQDLSAMDQNIGRGTKQWYALSQSTRNAIDALSKFQGTWGVLRESFRTPVYEIFTIFLGTATGLIKKMKPAITSATEGVKALAVSFDKAANGSGAREFFTWLGNTAGTYLETLGKAIGNLIAGFMNMMVAFDPLAQSMSQGFLKMTERFSAWSAGLGENAGFKSFVSFVNTNMPIIRQIFGDVFTGIINLFASFGENSELIFQKLSEMTTRFKAWSESIKQSDGFQKFIDYVQTNGPKVIDLIGNITNFIINLGVALAPMGSKMLDVINKVISFTSALMENHPVVGKIIAVVISLSGALMAVTPILIALQTAFGGFVGKAIAGFVKMGAKAVAWSVKTIAKLIAVAAKYAWLGVKAAAHAAKVATSFAVTMVKAATKAAASMTASMAKIIAKYAVLAAKSATHAAKVALTFTVTMVKAAAKGTASMIAAMAKMVAKYAWMAAKSMVHAAKVAASFVVAMGPVGWVIATVVALVALIVANWDTVKSVTTKVFGAVWSFIKDIASKIRNWVVDKFTSLVTSVSNKMNEAQTTITNIWNDVMAFFRGIDLTQIGKDIINGLINGIKSMAGAVVKAAKGVVDGAIQGAKNLLDINSPSRVFAQFGIYSGEGLINGLNKMDSKVVRASEHMASSLTGAFKPQLSFGVSASDIKTSDLSVDSQMQDFKRQIQEELKVDLYVHQDGNGRDRGGNREYNIQFNQPVDSPSQVTRKLKEWDRQMALEAGFS